MSDGEIGISCECERGLKPFEKDFEVHKCKCRVIFQKDGKGYETKTEFPLGWVTLSFKEWSKAGQ